MDAKTKTIPSADLLSFAFNEDVVRDETKPIYIDAQDPDHCLNYNQTKVLTRKLISGLKAFGLQQGDCVLVVLPNNVKHTSTMNVSVLMTYSFYTRPYSSASLVLAVSISVSTQPVSHLNLHML